MVKWFLTLLVPLLLFQPSPVMAAEADYLKPVLEQDAKASYVFLYVYRSAAFLDWSGPSRLAKTMLSSMANKSKNQDASSLGHAQVAWHCVKPDGSLVHGATGQTGEKHDQGADMVRSGWGLTILDMVFTDGELETPEQVAASMAKAEKNSNFAWLAMKVKPESCLAMVDYIQTYQSKGAGVNYGFPLDPLKYEGAGCTSFANAALGKLGFELPFYKSWIRQVRMPLKYMGKLDTVPPFTRALSMAKSPAEVKKVPVTEFIFKDITWATPEAPHQVFNYYDPELFYEALVHAENALRMEQKQPLRNPIRSQGYDGTQTQNKETVEAWVQQLQQTNKPLQLQQIRSVSGLVVDLR